jgi:hypothetical protein
VSIIANKKDGSNVIAEASEQTVVPAVATASSTAQNEEQTQVYFKRWIILSVFCLITLLNAFNWIEYSIVQDVVIQFYNERLKEILYFIIIFNYELV